MKKISIDELNEMVDSQYSLVTIISKRARQIIDGSEPLVKTSTKKPMAIAIEEFYNEKFEPIYDYDKFIKSPGVKKHRMRRLRQQLKKQQLWKKQRHKKSQIISQMTDYLI